MTYINCTCDLFIYSIILMLWQYIRSSSGLYTIYLSYSNAFIYLFFLLCSSHLVLIRCKVLLVADIRTKLPLILYSSSITTQTLYLFLTIRERIYLFYCSIKTFSHSVNPLPYHTLLCHLKLYSTYLILKYQYTVLWLFRVSVI